MTKRKLIIGVAVALLAAVSFVGCSKMSEKEKELRAQADLMEKGLELAFEQVDEVDAYTQTWYDKLEERYDTQWEIIDDRYYDSDDDSPEFKAHHDIAKEYIYQMWDISEDMLDEWYSILLERVDQLEYKE